MKMLLLIVLCVVFQGCTSIGLEKRDDGYLKLTVTTWFKSIDGFEAIRDKDGNVKVKFDKSHSTDVYREADKALDLINKVRLGGGTGG